MPIAKPRTSKKRSKPTRAKRRPTNAQLLKLARKHRPPQAWFEQSDVPFIPTKG